MTPAQLSEALTCLDLTRRDLPALFDVDQRTVDRWRLNEVRIPESVAIVLRLMMAGKVSRKDIEGARNR